MGVDPNYLGFGFTWFLNAPIKKDCRSLIISYMQINDLGISQFYYK